MDKIEHLKSYWQKLAYSPLNIKECGEEKIHLLGAIQDGAWLISYSQKDDEVLAVSENISELLGMSVEECLALPFSKLPIKIRSQQPLDDQITSFMHLEFENQKDKSFVGRTVASGSMVHLEIERDLHSSQDQDTRSLDGIRNFLRHSSNSKKLEEVLDRISQSIKVFTGYDRVMVYKFEPNHDGFVIAEAKNPDLEPFLGLRYPATDIPKQARDLFYQSASRIIVDTEALPHSLFSKRGMAPSEFDLSHQYFRATSPFHIEYLLNMGVRATFSLPIKIDGELWGLIACHHYSGPKLLNHYVRTSCEIIGQFISSKIASYLSEKRLILKNNILELSQKILDQITKGKSPINSFKAMGEDLVSGVAADGFAVKLGDNKIQYGVVPKEETLEGLTQFLKKQGSTTVWNSVKIQDQGLPYDENCVGCMAVPLSINFEDYLIWFRPAAQQTIKWAGRPKSAEEKKADRLSPRGSFQLWVESRVDQSLEWNRDQLESAQYILFSFVRDIFKKASELSTANRELEKVTRAKDEFIGMISHELRTPLNVIVGWTQIAVDLQIKDDSLKQAIETIDRNAKIQVNLINDLLDISRIISGKMKIEFESDLDMGKVVSEVVKDLEPTASAKGVVLNTDIEKEFLTSGSSDRLRQVVWNLVSNAIKFTPKGGAVNIQLAKLASSYQIIVSDTGIGIEAQNLPFIFDRFNQVDMTKTNRSSGLGLGLSIVKALVELHGGEVSAQSFGKDKGSIFTVTLPVYAVPIDERVLKNQNLVENKNADLKNLKILIAEDQEDAARALEITLKSLGAQVVVERDGKSAFAQFASCPEGEFDLIISDIGMPEWDGYTLIRNIRELEANRRSQKIQAIGLTAYAAPKDRVACLNAGYQYHLPKPVEKGELVNVILALMEQEKHEQESQ